MSRVLAGAMLASTAAIILAATDGSAIAAPASRALLQQPCSQTSIGSPTAGAVLEGRVAVSGSARIDDFNFYKVEYSSAHSPEAWAAVSETKVVPVINGLLDVWDTTSVPDGEYYLKLTVVDPIGQEVCRYTLRDLFVGNAGTPTPTPTPTPEESPTATPTAPADIDLEPTATPTPEPTAAPIVPSTGNREFFSGDNLGDVWGAFLRGFGAAVIVGLTGLIIVALRRR